jgi:hypothetical protein
MQEHKFTARGHANVRGTHGTTVMITTEPHLTARGDCIVAVASEIGLRDLPEDLKAAARSQGARIRLTFSVGGDSVEVNGRGDPGLTFEHPHDMVARRSSFTCPRTLMVHADKAAIDLPVGFRRLLRDPEAVVTVTISVESPE